jgi:hypothetical protein
LPWTVVIFSNAHASILKRLRLAHARAWAFSRRDLDPTLILTDVEFGDANGIAVLDLDPAKVAQDYQRAPHANWRDVDALRSSAAIPVLSPARGIAERSCCESNVGCNARRFLQQAIANGA